MQDNFTRAHSLLLKTMGYTSSINLTAMHASLGDIFTSRSELSFNSSLTSLLNPYIKTSLVTVQTNIMYTPLPHPTTLLSNTMLLIGLEQ